MLGAVVAASSMAGDEVALTTRCQAFSGMPKSEPGPHSKVCLPPPFSCHTSVVPRPSTT